MRLIDADAFKKMLAEEEIEFPMIDEQPTVDALPYDYILNIEEELRKKARESESQERKEFYVQNAEAINRLLVTWEVKGRGTVRGYDQTD